jgi:AcrR family transcriptional regulator
VPESPVGSSAPFTAKRRTRMSAADRAASIVAAATELFSEVGYHRCTMAEVARRVGVSEPVVFQNFGSKSAVFVAVIESAAQRVSTVMREQADAHPSVGAWLAELLGADLGHVHARGTLGVLFADATTVAGEPEVKDAIGRANRTVAGTVTELFTRGQKEGSIRQDLDPETSAWWLLSLLASQEFRFTAMPDRERLEGRLGAMTLRLLTSG